VAKRKLIEMACTLCYCKLEQDVDAELADLSGVTRNFFRGGEGGFNKFSWGQKTERTGILWR